MKQRRGTVRWFSLGLAVWLALFYAYPVTGAEVPSGTAPQFDSVVQVLPGKLSGKVTSVDGKTGLPGVSLQVVDVKTGKVVGEVTTDKQGKYVVGPLSAGSYQIVVAGWMVTVVEVIPQAKVSKLNFILPQAAYRFPAADVMSDVEAEAGSMVKGHLVRTAVITAAVTTLVVGPLVAVLTYRERGKKVVFVSPSVP